MNLKHPSRALSLALLLCLSTAATAQDTGIIERVQMGDNELDCVQIATQVEELDAILASHSGDKGALRGATESATRSRTGEVVAGVAKVLPFGSVFGDIAKDVLGRRGREAEARLASARARKEYLVDMFLKRGCRMADVAAATAQQSKSEKQPTAEAKPASEAQPEPAAPAAPATPDQQTPAKDTAPDAASGTGTPVQVPAVAPPAEPPSPAVEVKEAPPPAQSAPPEDAATPAPQDAQRGPLFVLDFRLAFRTSADADGEAGAPGLELGGVPLQTMQAITDAAYVALLLDLAKAGFEVLNPEVAAPLPGAGSLPAPARGGDYLYFAPSGAPLAQAPATEQPGSDAALGETRAALAQAVAGRKPGVSYAIGVWYVDFARIRGKPGQDEPQRLESRLAVSAGSHLAIVEPAAESTPPEAVRVLNLGRDLVTNEPYGQVRLPAGKDVLRLQADPKRFTNLVERQLKRGRSALISSLPPAPVAGQLPDQTPAH
mgnify:CR=1 FL=1